MRTYPARYTSNIPDWLAPTQDVPNEHEMALANSRRQPFLFAKDGLPYMVDVVRAMRLLKGRRTYVEVGTYDKGSLSYFSKLLAPDAHLIDVDIEHRPEHTTLLKEYLEPTQRLTTVVGDSSAASTLEEVKQAIGPGGADAVFIDGNHAAGYAFADYANFSRMMAPGGLMFFHDLYWEGDAQTFGVSRAMEWIDRVQPVHVVFSDHPVHRFLPWMDKNESIWGGMGIIGPF